eukprot:2513285-Amphidinium_carterae.3
MSPTSLLYCSMLIGGRLAMVHMLQDCLPARCDSKRCLVPCWAPHAPQTVPRTRLASGGISSWCLSLCTERP